MIANAAKTLIRLLLIYGGIALVVYVLWKALEAYVFGMFML